MATLREDWFVTSEGFENIGTDAGRRRQASYFVASASYTLDRIDLAARKVGAPGFSITCNIRAHGSNAPGSIISSSANSISAASLGTSETVVSFTGLNAALVSGTTYWVEFVVSAVSDFTNYAQLSWGTTQSYPGYTMSQKSDDGATWAAVGNLTFEFQAFSDSTPLGSTCTVHLD